MQASPGDECAIGSRFAIVTRPHQPVRLAAEARGLPAAVKALVVTQCAAKGTATGPGDCNLTSMQSITADASGRVRVEFAVSKGPFGANNIICGPAKACLISVTQATPSPAQEADAPISFG